MQIFDRYNADAVERKRYEARLEKARYSLREDYDRLGNLTVALFIVCFALAIALGIWGGEIPAAAAWTLGGAAALFLIAAFTGYYFVDKTGNDEWPDLYIYGMEAGDFLLLNPLYEEMERIRPGQVREIRILAAMKPTTRQWHIGRHYGEVTHYEYFGETTEAGETIAFPMAVLCTHVEDFDWRWIDDPIFRRDLQKMLTFVPFGENKQPFLHLLKNTACPVFIVREVYDAHQPALDELFINSGMDLSRLQFMQEETRQAQMTRII